MADQELVAKCRSASYRMRRHILDMTYSCKKVGAHVGGSLSIVELLAALYAGIIKYRKEDPFWEGRDRVILSKGHAALALYPALVEGGIIEEEESRSREMTSSFSASIPYFFKVFRQATVEWG